MSDTPRTDAAEFDFSEDCTPEDNMVVASCDMRKLECELNEAKADADALADALQKVTDECLWRSDSPIPLSKEDSFRLYSAAIKALETYRNKYKEGKQ